MLSWQVWSRTGSFVGLKRRKTKYTFMQTRQLTQTLTKSLSYYQPQQTPQHKKLHPCSITPPAPLHSQVHTSQATTPGKMVGRHNLTEDTTGIVRLSTNNFNSISQTNKIHNPKLTNRVRRLHKYEMGFLLGQEPHIAFKQNRQQI